MYYYFFELKLIIKYISKLCSLKLNLLLLKICLYKEKIRSTSTTLVISAY